MGQPDFSDAAVVLIGHGSTLNADSGAPVFQQASEVRRRGWFGAVREGFWKQEPRLIEVLPSLTAARVFLVPLFISEGYFSDEVIPQALGFKEKVKSGWSRVRRNGLQTQSYCRPLGTHLLMSSALLARAREVVEQFPFPRAPKPPDITLFIAGHGTEQNEQSRDAIEQHADSIRAMNLYAGVHAVFLEEDPRINACYQMAQTRNLVVAPFFISAGLHVSQDIPVLLGEPERVVHQRLQNGQPSWRNPTEKHGKRVWYAASVGTHPMLAEIILERVKEAATWQDGEPAP